MSASSNISSLDTSNVDLLTSKLPQSLIIKTQSGLDTVAALDKLVGQQPSEVFNITPLPDKKTISVEQIRDQMAQFSTFAKKRRILIISPANLMTREAQNALLKDLEEPSRGLHIILVAVGDDRLLETIHSRCQLLTLHRTTAEQDEALLSDAKLDDQAKQQILFLAKGRPLLINELASSPARLQEMKQLVEAAKVLLSGKPYDKLRIVSSHANSRTSALELIDVALSILGFQLRRSGSTATAQLIYKLTCVEQSIRSNANVKLSLLQLL